MAKSFRFKKLFVPLTTYLPNSSSSMPSTSSPTKAQLSRSNFIADCSYVSTMVPVKDVKEYDIQLDVAVLFSETLVR